METTTVTIDIPERLYRRLQWVSEATNRAIPDVLIATTEAVFARNTDDTGLPDELADELAAMQLFSDQALWDATKPILSTEQQERMRELSQEQQERVLSPVEQDELRGYVSAYDRAVLRRAQAFALLALRGHTVPDLNMRNGWHPPS